MEIGSNLKLVSGTYESYQSWALTADLMAMRRFKDAPDVIVMLKNTGFQLSAYSNQRESLPTNFFLQLAIN